MENVIDETTRIENFRIKKFQARKKTGHFFLIAIIFRIKFFERKKKSHSKIFKPKKCKNQKSQNGAFFRIPGDITILGSREKFESGKFPAQKILSVKKTGRENFQSQNFPTQKKFGAQKFRL
jgi:hypothetical protein